MSIREPDTRQPVQIAADGIATSGGKSHSRSRLRLLIVAVAVLAQLVLIWLVVVNLRQHFTTLYIYPGNHRPDPSALPCQSK